MLFTYYVAKVYATVTVPRELQLLGLMEASGPVVRCPTVLQYYYINDTQLQCLPSSV